MIENAESGDMVSKFITKTVNLLFERGYGFEHDHTKQTGDAGLTLRNSLAAILGDHLCMERFCVAGKRGL